MKVLNDGKRGNFLYSGLKSSFSSCLDQVWLKSSFSSCLDQVWLKSSFSSCLDQVWHILFPIIFLKKKRVNLLIRKKLSSLNINMFSFSAVFQITGVIFVLYTTGACFVYMWTIIWVSRDLTELSTCIL